VSKKLFIGIALAGAAPLGFVASLVRYAQAAPAGTVIAFDTSGGNVGMARNNLTAQFLLTDCTHLLFIDSDIIFEPDQVARLTSHDVPIIGGLYPLKTEGELQLCGNGFTDRETPILENGLQQIRYIGTGFMLVAREVILTVIGADRAEIEYQKDEAPHRTQWDLWRMGVRATADPRRRFLTEDWFFCQRAGELGFTVWADTQVCLRHIGTAIWPLPHQRQRDAGPQ
jgi:hypothetical protein